MHYQHVFTKILSSTPTPLSLPPSLPHSLPRSLPRSLVVSLRLSLKREIDRRIDGYIYMYIYIYIYTYIYIHTHTYIYVHQNPLMIHSKLGVSCMARPRLFLPKKARLTRRSAVLSKCGRSGTLWRLPTKTATSVKDILCDRRARTEGRRLGW